MMYLDSITSYNYKAIMSSIVKPTLTVLAVVKVPDWLGVFLSGFTTENISQYAVLVSQIGGAIYILFKIYDWIQDKLKDNEAK